MDALKSHPLTRLAMIAILLLVGNSYAAKNSAPKETVEMDRIVAIVNQDVITAQELEDRIRSVVAQMEKQGKQLPPDNVLQKQILERLIADSLQMQLAKDIGIKVDDTQLDKTIMRIADQNKMSMEEFKVALQKDGISYSKFREDIRSEITIARVKEREVDERINVSDGEIDNYLTTQASTNSNDEMEISHILIRTPEDSTPEDLNKAKNKLAEAMSKLDKGESFEQVSASYSDAPNALEGGSLGWKTTSQIPELFLAPLQGLQVGQISSPIRSPNGFHILKVTNRRGGSSPLVIEQTHARHILLKLNEVVSEKDAKQKMDNIKERLDHGTKFEDMARQYSEDGSASAGGDLGWVNPGDTVPQFEEAMNRLKPNEISEPVRSPFGWHIIQVLERRKQDMTKEASRMKARQEIRARKAEENYQDWLHELRDRAFVELHLEDKY